MNLGKIVGSRDYTRLRFLDAIESRAPEVAKSLESDVLPPWRKAYVLRETGSSSARIAGALVNDRKRIIRFREASGEPGMRALDVLAAEHEVELARWLVRHRVKIDWFIEAVSYTLDAWSAGLEYSKYDDFEGFDVKPGKNWLTGGYVFSDSVDGMRTVNFGVDRWSPDLSSYPAYEKHAVEEFKRRLRHAHSNELGGHEKAVELARKPSRVKPIGARSLEWLAIYHFKPGTTYEQIAEMHRIENTDASDTRKSDRATLQTDSVRAQVAKAARYIGFPLSKPHTPRR